MHYTFSRLSCVVHLNIRSFSFIFLSFVSLTQVKFIKWIFRAFGHAILIYVITFSTLGQDVAGPDGMNHGLAYTSTIIYMSVVILATLRILLDVASISIIHEIVLFFSFWGYLFIQYTLSLVVSLNPDLYGVVAHAYTTLSTWLIVLLTVLTPILFDAAFLAIRREWFPSYVDIVQERQHMNENELKILDRDYHASETVLQVRTSEKVTRRAKQNAKLITKVQAALHRSSVLKTQQYTDALMYMLLRYQNMSGSAFDATSTKEVMKEFDKKFKKQRSKSKEMNLNKQEDEKEEEEEEEDEEEDEEEKGGEGGGRVVKFGRDRTEEERLEEMAAAKRRREATIEADQQRKSRMIGRTGSRINEEKFRHSIDSDIREDVAAARSAVDSLQDRFHRNPLAASESDLGTGMGAVSPPSQLMDDDDDDEDDDEEIKEQKRKKKQRGVAGATAAPRETDSGRGKEKAKGKKKFPIARGR